MAKPKSIHQTVRDAVQATDVPHVRIAAAAGIHTNTLSAFVNKRRGMHAKQMDRLLNVIGMELVAVRRK